MVRRTMVLVYSRHTVSKVRRVLRFACAAGGRGAARAGGRRRRCCPVHAMANLSVIEIVKFAHLGDHQGALRFRTQGCKAVWARSPPHVTRPPPYHCTRRAQQQTEQKSLLLTSASTPALVRASTFEYAGTPLAAAQLDVPLWLYHEYSLDRRHNRSGADAWEAVVLPRLLRDSERDVCAVDLFSAISGLFELIADSSSCIDAFYRVAGRREPFAGRLPVATGKVLVRKLAALHHALQLVPSGSTVIWLDFDVVPQVGRLSGVGFLEFVTSRDLTYIPFTSRNRTPREASMAARVRDGLDQPLSNVADLVTWPQSWSVDSGVLAVRRSSETQQLLWRMLQHYDGGAFALVEACLCGGGEAWQQRLPASSPPPTQSSHAVVPCQQTWFQRNLYLDDLFVWTLFVHAELRGWSNPLLYEGAHAEVPRTSMQHPDAQVPASKLRHGWFGLGTPLSKGTRAQSARAGASRGSQYRRGCDRSGMPGYMVTVCPNTTQALVSPFDLNQVLRHRIMSGAYKAEQASQSLGGKYHRATPKELDMPPSPNHHLLLQEVLAARYQVPSAPSVGVARAVTQSASVSTAGRALGALQRHAPATDRDRCAGGTRCPTHQEARAVRCAQGLPCLTAQQVRAELAAHAQAWQQPPLCKGASQRDGAGTGKSDGPRPFQPRRPLLRLVEAAGFSPPRRNRTQIVSRTGANARPSETSKTVAVCITGIARGFDCNTATRLYESLRLASTDSFLHIALEGVSRRVLLEMTRWLQPVAARFETWTHTVGTLAGLLGCSNASEYTANLVSASPAEAQRPMERCVAEDSDDPRRERSVGCYKKGCEVCDASKYLLQTLRRFLCWQLVREHERHHRARPYNFVVYARIDAAAWQLRRLPPSMLAPEAAGLLGLSIYVLEFRRFGVRVPDDNFAVVARGLADAYFGAFGSFTQCQRREDGEPLCTAAARSRGSQWGIWATPECLLKLHLHRCGIEAAGAEGGRLEGYDRLMRRVRDGTPSRSQTTALRSPGGGFCSKRRRPALSAHNSTARPPSGVRSAGCGAQSGAGACVCARRQAGNDGDGDAPPSVAPSPRRRWSEFVSECAPVLDAWCLAECPLAAKYGRLKAVRNAAVGNGHAGRLENSTSRAPEWKWRCYPVHAPDDPKLRASAYCTRDVRLPQVLRKCGNALLASGIWPTPDIT